jgi:DNA-binding MarR family transcriptional regulator
MSKKQEFIDFIEELIKNSNKEIPENVKTYWEAFCSKEENEKPMFTDDGKMILKCMQDNHEKTQLWKAKDIAEELFVSSRKVSGAIRKLVNDGFVEKLAKEPVVYELTEKGKNIVIE